MIYTLTMNPAADYILTVDGLTIGKVNRALSAQEEKSAGKGVNVSRFLTGLGVENTAIVAGINRTNVKIHHDGCVTEINAAGQANEQIVNEVAGKLTEIKKGDWLIMSGSLPGGVNECFYEEICKSMCAKGVKAIVDTSGEPLRRVAETEWAWLIKPNRQELSELGENTKIWCNALVSMDVQGAMLTIGSKVYTITKAYQIDELMIEAYGQSPVKINNVTI